MTDELRMDPDERAFSTHLQRVAFQVGVDAGRWRVVKICWPHAIFGVSAAQREGAPSEFLLRFELSNYPGSAPKAAPWDPSTGTTLATDKWPKGERAAMAFRPGWRTDALYVPCDREGLAAHPDWRQKYPRTAWNESRDIAHYLAVVHGLLNDEDYTGV